MRPVALTGIDDPNSHWKNAGKSETEQAKMYYMHKSLYSRCITIAIIDKNEQ